MDWREAGIKTKVLELEQQLRWRRGTGGVCLVFLKEKKTYKSPLTPTQISLVTTKISTVNPKSKIKSNPWGILLGSLLLS